MRKLSTLTLTGQRTSDKLQRGKLELAKGRGCRAVGLKVAININNVSGGAVALTDAQRQTLLGGLELTLSYGKNGRRKPYAGMSFARLQRIARYLLGSEWEGYTDATSGLARSLPNAATTKVEFYAKVPTLVLWQDKKMRKLLGMGRTQAKSMELELKRQVDALPAGCTISGNVTVDVFTDDYSAPWDRYGYLPEWHEVDEVDRVVRLPAGLPLLVTERSAAHAASLLSDYSLSIDGELVDERVSAAEAITGYLDTPNIPAEASLTDRETILYAIGADVAFEDLPTGGVRIEQHKKDLATFQAGALIAPIVPDTEVREDVAEFAGAKYRNKTLKAVSIATVLGVDLPKRLAPFVPFVLFDSDDQEFERFPGMVSASGGPAEVFVPNSLLASARALVAQHEANGEHRAAENAIRDLALPIPGAVQHPRGFSAQGSVVLDQVRAAVRG